MYVRAKRVLDVHTYMIRHVKILYVLESLFSVINTNIEF